MKNILLPIDFTPKTRVGLETVVRLASPFGSEVRLLHVAPPDPAFAHSRAWPQEVRDEMAKELKKEHDQIRGMAQELEEAGISAKSFIARGSIVDTIVNFAEDAESDLIVLAAKREGSLAQFVTGSVVRGVLKRAPCQILIVPVGAAPAG